MAGRVPLRCFVRCSIGALLFCAVPMAPAHAASVATAAPCALDVSSAARDQTVRLTFRQPGDATTAMVMLTRPAGDEGDAPKPGSVPVEKGVAIFSVPKVPLGAYQIAATLEPAPAGAQFCGPLQVQLAPPKGTLLRMFDFQPPVTYAVRTVTLPDPDKPNETRSASVVSMVVRGTGFVTDFPGDNQILVDHQLKPVQWRTEPCPPAQPVEHRSAEPRIVGYVT